MDGWLLLLLRFHLGVGMGEILQSLGLFWLLLLLKSLFLFTPLTWAECCWGIFTTSSRRVELGDEVDNFFDSSSEEEDDADIASGANDFDTLLLMLIL